MYCEKCGKQLAEDAKFCDECGTKVSPPVNDQVTAEEPKAASPPPPPPPPPPPAPTPPPVQQPRNNNSYNTYNTNTVSLDKPLSIGAYLGMFILMAIPIVNIVMICVWAFGSNSNVNKKNFAIASLILAAIAFVLWLVFFVILASVFSSLWNFNYYY